MDHRISSNLLYKKLYKKARDQLGVQTFGVPITLNSVSKFFSYLISISPDVKKMNFVDIGSGYGNVVVPACSELVREGNCLGVELNVDSIKQMREVIRDQKEIEEKLQIWECDIMDNKNEFINWIEKQNDNSVILYMFRLPLQVSDFVLDLISLKTLKTWHKIFAVAVMTTRPGVIKQRWLKKPTEEKITEENFYYDTININGPNHTLYTMYVLQKL